MVKITPNILFIKLVVFLQLIYISNGDRIKDKMYEEISSTSACYRRLNGTHQIGCSSKRGGSTGVIHFCEHQTDLEDIIAQGTGNPYIPILPLKLFNPTTLNIMINSNKISGLILHNNNESEHTIDNLSHENQCPNPESSLNGTCKKESVWNPWGTGLLYVDIPFPVFYVKDTNDVLLIKDCFVKFNNFSFKEHADRSLCSLELLSFMHATTDTPTCMRRSNIMTNLNPQKFCDPLGSKNVWAALQPLAEGPRSNETKPIKDYKYIVVAARLDTTSLFEKTSGANSPVTGIVTLLSLAKFLNDTVSIEDVKSVKKNVLFLLFNGESYDYIGSQRMVYDMVNNNFPLNHDVNTDILPSIGFNDIELFVELSQLGNANETLYVHHLNEIQAAKSFLSKLKQSSFSIDFEDVSHSLPPSSLHSFLKENIRFPGLLIADHKTTYSNHFYNSIYDNSTNIKFQYYNTTQEGTKIPSDSIQYFIKNVAEAIGKSIYQEITRYTYNGTNEVDVELVNELLHCYLEDPNCKVYEGIKVSKLPKTPLSLYVSVNGTDNIATALTALTLGWFTGKSVGLKGPNCTNADNKFAYRYYNLSKSINELNTTVCYQITMNLVEAVSPAFLIDDYDWSSGQYSSWAESTWKVTNVRMFLKPLPSQGRITIAIGLITMIFSFALVFFIKSKSDILFKPSIQTGAPTDC